MGEYGQGHPKVFVGLADLNLPFGKQAVPLPDVLKADPDRPFNHLFRLEVVGYHYIPIFLLHSNTQRPGGGDYIMLYGVFQ